MGRKDLDSHNDDSSLSPRSKHPFYNTTSDNTDEVEEEMQNENTESVSEEVEEESYDDETEYEEEEEQTGLFGTKKKHSIAKKIILILIPFILLFLFLIIIIAVIASIFGISIGEGGEYNIRCHEVTVLMADKSNNYQITGSATYDFDDYIAGVVAAEVGGFNNIEVYKTIAIAARTYLLTHDDGKCIIESSDRKQVFTDVTSQRNTNSLIYQAVIDTKDQVILNGKSLASVQYDAFCTIDVDSNYYTLKQRNQKIPRGWADSQSGISSEWKQGHCEGNHGNGISQWGAYYLASQQNYTAEQILAYYIGGKNITLSTPLNAKENDIAN